MRSHNEVVLASFPLEPVSVRVEREGEVDDYCESGDEVEGEDESEENLFG